MITTDEGAYWRGRSLPSFGQRVCHLARPTSGAEALYSARSPAEYAQVRCDRREAHGCLPTDDGPWRGAFDAQRVLARTGRHRAVETSSLLTVVLAAAHRMTSVHYDADCEIATEVLSFEHRRLLPRGSA